MDRRKFLTLSGAGLILPVTAAQAFFIGDPLKTKLAGSVFYTKENPGRWAKKIDSHLPQMEKVGSTLRITTDHGMSSKHYIVKHMLFDKDFNLLGEKMLDPSKDDAVSDFDIGQYTGKLYATSFCNKHDNWLNSVEV